MTNGPRSVRVSHKRLFQKRQPPAGARPGTLALPKDSPKPKLHAMAYGPDGLVEQESGDIAQIKPLLDKHAVVWLDVQGLGDEKTLLAIGDLFALHPVALADVVNLPQRPKTESYEGQQLFICGMLRIDESGDIDSD